jgi:putative sterol carrier protein
LEKAKGTVRFELADGKRVDRWLLAVDKGDLSVSRRNVGADCTFHADKALFDRIVDGEVNATAAFLRGAVTIDGDMELLVQLQKLFPGPPAKRRRRRNGANGRGRT